MNDTKKQLDKPNSTEGNGNLAGPQFNYAEQLNRNDGCNLESYSQRLGNEPDTNAEKDNTRLLPSLTFILRALMLCHCHLDRGINNGPTPPTQEKAVRARRYKTRPYSQGIAAPSPLYKAKKYKWDL